MTENFRDIMINSAEKKVFSRKNDDNCGTSSDSNVIFEPGILLGITFKTSFSCYVTIYL